MFDFKVAVVIPMAGFSERFPSPCQKQYIKILGKPLFMFCVEEFYKLAYIKKICLVSDRVEFVQNLVEEKFKSQEKIIVVKGGSSRHISIKNGLLELSKFNDFYKVIVVHDGARPIVPEQLLVKLILGAEANGAAGATRPLISTIVKPLNDDCLETSLDRNAYLSSETPQAFLYHLIIDAYQKSSDDDLEKGTECLQLLLKYCGIRAKLIPGPESLWKVTNKRDFYSVLSYLKELSTDVCLLGDQESEIIRGLKASLTSRVCQVDCFASEKDMKPSQKLYNTIVHFDATEMDQENRMYRFGSIIDINRQGLIIHTVEHSSFDRMQSMSVYELYRSGRNMRKQYEKLNKGVVTIHYLSHEEKKKLIDLIVSLIFTDVQTISGQTLFL